MSFSKIKMTVKMHWPKTHIPWSKKFLYCIVQNKKDNSLFIVNIFEYKINSYVPDSNNVSICLVAAAVLFSNSENFKNADDGNLVITVGNKWKLSLKCYTCLCSTSCWICFIHIIGDKIIIFPVNTENIPPLKNVQRHLSA